MRLSLLSNKISWFGKYSGYECLTNYFPTSIEVGVISPRDKVFNKIIGKVVQKVNGWIKVQPAEIFAEIKFFAKLNGAEVSHILYLENHLHCLKDKFKKENLIGTIHLPFKQWKPEMLKKLELLPNAIVLYQEEIPLFSKYIDPNKIQYIKHGVDTDFFCPGNDNLVEKNKILFVGHYLRNFKMFLEVYHQINKDRNRKAIEFHFLIPSFFRGLPSIRDIVGLPNVFFHEGLSDEALLRFYQTSYVLLMPMEDSGANTAIVQALSTGLPIITTNVGGIKSYGGGEVFPIVNDNDVVEMVRLFEKYYSDNAFRTQISNAQRKFAVEQLDWRIISKKHIDVYKRLLK